jgi:hypothetical protein
MAESYSRTLVETKAAILLIPQSARVLAKHTELRRPGRTLVLGCFVPSVKGNYKPPVRYVTVTSVFFAASTVIS